MKRIKHNDLIPWFTMNHADLPPAYLKSCQKFFDSIKSEKNNLIKHWSAVAKASSRKQQASSSEPQASSNKRQAVISNKEVTSLKRSELMKFLQWHYSQNYLKSLSIEDLRRLYKDWQKHHNVI